MVEIESQPHCANCSRQVHEDWIICPTCRNRLRRVCPNCSRLIELDWSLCAWCGKDFERPELLQEAGVVPPIGSLTGPDDLDDATDALPEPDAPTIPALAPSSIDARVPDRPRRPAVNES
jgi:RNA polymerase subunit RPABC4/transcription elongation factor Spt4